ncbi:MAG TPA: SurA N-terminal domain-containing protein [Trebonia sp.]|nr:SurA N-terminal domain-containing protein [Trebonia sp.]
MAGRKFRVAGIGAVAAAGACVMLSACSSVQMGAAAIVGNQRITQSALDTQVSNLKQAASGSQGQVQLTAAQMPQAVLGWLIKFSIEDRAAAAAGISVSQSQIQQGTADIEQQAGQYASQQGGGGSAQAILLSSGISPQMLPDLGKYQAQELALAARANGGKLPTTTAQDNAVTAALTKSSCQAAKSLNIKVNPQFGRLDYTQFSVVPTSDTLSRTPGKPSPAPTSGRTPAC